MAELGDILKKKARAAGEGPANVQLIGVQGSNWVAQNSDIFAGPFSISPNDLRSDYGGDGDPVPAVDEIEAWSKMSARALSAATRKARIDERERVEAEDWLTPEESLAIQGRADEAAQAGA